MEYANKLKDQLKNQTDNLGEKSLESIFFGNHYTELHQICNDLKKDINFIEHFPTMKDYKTYDVYKTQLVIMKFLQ